MAFSDQTNVTTKRLGNHTKVPLDLFDLLLFHGFPFRERDLTLHNRETGGAARDPGGTEGRKGECAWLRE